ncbi:hypothetical protein NDU88_005559 [Pleurodeles waltl]|uniref:Uncharacterized protein n=1 Tax=Pleurodeles waltl TaxID=8319 RepID=A0AAV7WBU5_PLEWA|nr:hypothetical protein NDU88_005559 [Pleurodeles waltl]
MPGFLPNASFSCLASVWPGFLPGKTAEGAPWYWLEQYKAGMDGVNWQRTLPLKRWRQRRHEKSRKGRPSRQQAELKRLEAVETANVFSAMT